MLWLSHPEEVNTSFFDAEYGGLFMAGISIWFRDLTFMETP